MIPIKLLKSSVETNCLIIDSMPTCEAKNVKPNFDPWLKAVAMPVPNLILYV